jgi:hypothetical protein
MFIANVQTGTRAAADFGIEIFSFKSRNEKFSVRKWLERRPPS